MRDSYEIRDFRMNVVENEVHPRFISFQMSFDPFSQKNPLSSIKSTEKKAHETDEYIDFIHYSS